MTLGKYIQRLTDKLDRFKQFEKEKAAENARKARTTTQPDYHPRLRPQLLKAQYWRYGYRLKWSRSKRGVKNLQGQLLPRTG